MTHEEFTKVFNNRVSKSMDVMVTKAAEYAMANNRLHNFDAAAAMLNTTPQEALWGMLAKHIISVQDMVQSGEIPSQAWIDEKIGDCINYFILLEATFIDQLANLQEFQHNIPIDRSPQ